MADGLGAVGLPSERGDDERVHVEAGLGEVGLRGQVGDVADLEEDDADDIAAPVGELVRVIPLLALQTLDPQSSLALFDGLGLGRVLVFGCLVVVDVVILVFIVISCPPAKRRGRGRARRLGWEWSRRGDRGQGRGIDAGGGGLGRSGARKGGKPLKHLSRGCVSVCSIVEGELQQHLAGHDAGFLAWSLAPQGEPLRWLFGLLAGENLLQREIELAEVVLPESVLVPAADIENEALCAGDGHVALFVPFGV